MGKVDSRLEDLQKAGLYLVELIRAALNDVKAEEKPADVKWELVYHLVQKNSVDGISAYGVETLENKPPQEIWSKWKQAPTATTFRILQFDVEREQILAEMKKAGLSYMPLKGVHIANYYPKPGMRMMADNDILYGFVEADEEGGYRVKEDSVVHGKKIMDEIMKKRGYKLARRREKEDIYHKEPIFNFEMHKRVVEKTSHLSFYYNNLWKRLCQDEQDCNLYIMRDEDEFIYFWVHAYEHFTGQGFGIRFLADAYVILNRMEKTLDWNYIDKELKILNINDFVKKSITITKSIFSKEHTVLTLEEKEFVFYLLQCGTFGTVESAVTNKMKKIASDGNKSEKRVKLHYIWKRLFPDNEWWKDAYPIGYNRPYLWPFLTIYRMVRGILVHPKQLFKEWKVFRKKQL